MRKFFLSFVAAAMLMVAPAAAHAQSYNTFKVGDFTVSITQLTAGGPITVTVCCFANGSSVTFTIFSTPVVLGTATANAQGVATGTFTLPSNLAAGTHHIEASGVDASGKPITVSSPTLVAGRHLARTGASNNTLPIAAGGAGIAVVGAGLVLVARRRRNTEPTVAA